MSDGVNRFPDLRFDYYLPDDITLDYSEFDDWLSFLSDGVYGDNYEFP